jgi:hypothetical protein
LSYGSNKLHCAGDRKASIYGEQETVKVIIEIVVVKLLWIIEVLRNKALGRPWNYKPQKWKVLKCPLQSRRVAELRYDWVKTFTEGKMEQKEISAKLKTIRGEMDALITAIDQGIPPPPPTGPVLIVDQSNPVAADTNPGTETLPLKTIQAGHDKAVPGTTILIKAGVYQKPTNLPGFEWTPVLEVTKGGTAAAPITFQAYKRADGKYDTVILDAQLIYARACWVHNCSYINFDGLTFIGGQRQGIRLGSGQHGDNPFVDPALNITVKNCVARDNGMPNTWFGGFEVVGPSRDILFFQCESFRNGQGFNAGVAHHLIRDQQPWRVRFERCYAHDNTKGGGNSNGLIFDGCVDSQIVKCVAFGNSDTGIGSQGPYCDNQLFEDCVVFGAPAGGNSRGAQFNNVNPQILSQGHWGGRGTIVKNCFFYDNSFGRGCVDGNGSDGAQYLNNVSYRNGANDPTGWGFLLESNSGLAGYAHIMNGCTFTGNVAVGNNANATDLGAGWPGSIKFSDYITISSGQLLGQKFNNVSWDQHSRIIANRNLTPICDTNLWVTDQAYRIPNTNFGTVTGLSFT